MQIGILRSYSIIFRSVGLTLLCSLRILFANWFKSRKLRIDRLAYRWAKKILALPKIIYHVHNPNHAEIPKERPCVIMSNHASLYDIPLIFAAFPQKRIRMIAKKELFRVPIWGAAMRASGFVSIDRNNPKQALRDLKKAEEKMREGLILWMSPEGTRSRTGKLNAFKSGGFKIAMETKAIIIPVGIRGAFRVLPPKTFRFSLGETVDIHIGKPIDTTIYSSSERLKLMQAVESEIRYLCGEKV